MEQHLYRDGTYSADMDDLKGLTLTAAYKNDDDNELVFETDEWKFTFFHDQDCCEHVYIESIVGDLQDLIGCPLEVAEEVTHQGVARSHNNKELEDWADEDSCTWTFYKFATRKGWVDVRWLGSSNGYYSESVELKAEKK